MHVRQRAVRLLTVLAAMVTALGTALVVQVPATAGPPRITVQHGATQPVFALQEAIRETVYVTAQMDSDSDGQQDRIAVELIRPAETEQGLQVASVLRASPYHSFSSAPRRDGLIIPGALPAHFDAWYDEYFVPRGYAVVEADMQGTGDSEGCAATGGSPDTLSAKAAVDWLGGRATAVYADGTPAVASWSTGAVGMIGTSYAGTLPIALAETGVAGLRTILPNAAISSWYDYTRAQGIGFYSGFETRYPESLARIVSNARAASLCDDEYRQLGDQAGDDTYDYTPFYEARNFRDQTDRLQASVLLSHGQQDNNVKTVQFGRYWNELAAHGVPRKLYLHDGAHTDPFGSDLDGRDLVGRWMDHWLYDIQNGVMTEPQVTIRRPDGTRNTYPTWPAADAAPTTYHLSGPGTGAAGTLVTSPGAAGSQQFTDNPRQEQAAMVSDPQTAKPNRLAYLTTELPAARRLSGTGQVRLAFTASSTSTPLSALLVHYTNGQPTRVVARGAIDAKNRASLTTGTPLVPGQAYRATVELEPKDYVFPAGSRIGLIVAANNTDYIATDPLAAQVTVALQQSTLTLPLA